MGIPHLITRLVPYAVDTDLAGASLVIDGPAFAYHIYYLCVAAQKGARNPFQAVPNYDVIEAMAIRWLKEVQSCDVDIGQIYFDGDLPAAKYNTRISRLQNYTRQLLNYHASWPQRILDGDIVYCRPSLQLDGAGPSSSLTNIPAAPFLVPAVIAALKSSGTFAHVLKVVPGEADQYCALYARKVGGVVLTSDSDLLVHDLGRSGTVAFFRDIRFSTHDAMVSVRCAQYNLKHISERLGLDEKQGMLDFAFELFTHPHMSMPELRKRTVDRKGAELSPEDFKSFCSQYTNECFESSSHNSQLETILQGLHPRVSEFFLQFYRLHERTRNTSSMPEHEPHTFDIFLPFLLDCPIKTSAWELSTVTRQFAYGLVNLLLPSEEQLFSVHEYRRVQNGGYAREWQVAPLQLLEKTGQAVQDLLTTLAQKQAEDPDLSAWTMLALHQEMSRDMSLPAKPFTDAISNGSSNDPATTDTDPARTTWENIHMLAQLHGLFYSFQILEQISGAVLSLFKEVSAPEWLDDLYLMLGKLPDLKDLMGLKQMTAWLRSENAKKELYVIRDLLGLPSQNISVAVLPKKAKKKRRKPRKNKTHGSRISSTSDVAYTVLEEE